MILVHLYGYTGKTSSTIFSTFPSMSLFILIHSVCLKELVTQSLDVTSGEFHLQRVKLQKIFTPIAVRFSQINGNFCKI